MHSLPILLLIAFASATITFERSSGAQAGLDKRQDNSEPAIADDETDSPEPALADYETDSPELTTTLTSTDYETYSSESTITDYEPSPTESPSETPYTDAAAITESEESFPTTTPTEESDPATPPSEESYPTTEPTEEVPPYPTPTESAEPTDPGQYEYSTSIYPSYNGTNVTAAIPPPPQVTVNAGRALDAGVSFLGLGALGLLLAYL